MSDFTGLSRDELEQRLRAAEDVCVMVGWTGTGGSERGLAADELWHRWAGIMGHEYTGPAAHPELAGAEAALARQRTARTQATVARMIADGLIEIVDE